MLKGALEHALVLSGLPALGRFRHRDDVLILAYHNVLPAGEVPAGDTSLHITKNLFVRQLDAICRTHDVVPLSSIFEPSPGGRRPRAVVTFDDAYCGALDVGLSELARRELPATVFVAPGLLGQFTWWDLLSDPATGAIADAARASALSDLAGDGNAILALHDSTSRSLRPAFRIATESELAAVAGNPGITFASHSWSHSNLSALEQDRVVDELRRSMAWLRERFACSIPWVSYPYGLFSASVKQAVASAGLVAALRVDGGWLRAGATSEPFSLPRFNVPSGLSVHGLRLRLGGVGAT